MATNTPNPASPPPLRSSRKNWIVLAVALALGGLAAYAASHYLSERMAEIDARATEFDTVQVLVAKASLRAGASITANTVAVREIPRTWAHSGAITPDHIRAFFAEQAKLNKQAKAAQDSFWSASTVAQGKDTLEEGSAFRFIAEKGLEGASKHTGLLGAVDFNEWVTMSIQRAIGNVQSRMQDGLAVLATVGSTSPFVGLFGTVWGIYNALVKIGMSGQASIDKVAGPVGESLIMTAIGLAVAVPAVLGYNWLVRRNKAIMEDVNAFGSDLHSVLLASSNK